MASLANDGQRVVVDLFVEPTADGISAMHGALGQVWPDLQQSAGVDERWCTAFAIAVGEVAANIVEHACPPDEPAIPFQFEVLRYPDRLVGRFVDRGVPANPSDSPVMPSVQVPFAELSERGRGLALVQATTDRFEYQRTEAGENVWTIEKRFPG